MKQFLPLVSLLLASGLMPQLSQAEVASTFLSDMVVPAYAEQSHATRDSVDESDKAVTVSNDENTTHAVDEIVLASKVESRLQAGDTLYLNLDPVDVDVLVPQISDTKIYRLNYRGELVLPVIGNVPLAGLSESEAIVRLRAETLLQGYEIELSLLPLEPIGSDALKLFGAALFNTSPADTNADNIPVPADYVVGSGDTIVVQLYGKKNETYELHVSREGVINFPDIGPIQVGGRTFGSMETNIKERVAEQLIGVKVYVTMGDLRSINIVLAGEVVRPGTQTVSSLSTITNVLIASGGLSDRGSLRNIQVKRGDRVVGSFDLYELLLNGDDSNDIRLKPGDVVFVPPLGAAVTVSGEVQRPAIYELKTKNTIEALLKLAGGPTSTAYVQQVQVTRIGPDGKRVVMDIDYTSPDGKRTLVQNGDIVTIPRVLDQIENGVELIGHVKRPGKYQWSEGMRLSDLVDPQTSLKAKPDLDYALIRREQGWDQRVSVFSVSLRAADNQDNEARNTFLLPNDRVYVFGFETNGERQSRVKALVKELKEQANGIAPTLIVNVSGAVRAEGVYPLEPGMLVSDLIEAAGKLKEEAYPVWAELTRYSRSSTAEQKIEHISIDLSSLLKGDPSADIALQPRDHLSIKQVPGWVEQATVEIEGEVRFPGVYPIARGESLASVLKRAGKLTDFAAPYATIFTRESLKEKEAIQLDRLTERLETELKSTLLEKVEDVQRPQEALLIANEILEQLRATKPVGRLVIDMPSLIADMQNDYKSDYDIILEDGDKIIIPPYKQEVSVVGEVFQPTSHVYYPDRNAGDYISASGGHTLKADRKNTYVIHADGSVSRNKSWGYVGLNKGKPGLSRRIIDSSGEVGPGDTVAVPLDVERVHALKFWRDVSSILFQLAVSAKTIDDIQDN